MDDNIVDLSSYRNKRKSDEDKTVVGEHTVPPPEHKPAYEQPVGIASDEAIIVDARAFNRVLAALAFYANQGWDNGAKSRAILTTLNIVRTPTSPNNNGDDIA